MRSQLPTSTIRSIQIVMVIPQGGDQRRQFPLGSPAEFITG